MEVGGPGSAAEQSPGEIHRLVAAAPVQHRPVAAWYDGTRRLLCPQVVGYNQPGEWRVFCYQYGGETKSGPVVLENPDLVDTLRVESFYVLR
jgi:hypothetical protein